MLKQLLPALLVLFSLSVDAQPCIQNSHSLSFNGFSDVTLNSDNNLQISGSITVEAWIYPTVWAISSAQGTIVCHHSWTSGGEMGYVLRAGGNGELSFNIAGMDTNGVAMSWQEALSISNALSLNTWSHVAGTFDGSTVKVFINGLQVGSTAFTGTIVPPVAFPLSIGSLSDGGMPAGRYWNGRMDEVRIWSRALTGAELASNMNTHISAAQQTGLVGYWRFNEGMGTTLADSSASGNNGTASGTTFITQVPFNQSAATPVIIPNGNVLTSTLAVTYQWNLNGNAIPNATGQSWTAVQNGTYTVTVTDSLGCFATSGPYFITGVGISELNDGYNLSYYCENGNLFIQCIRGEMPDWISLLDMGGRTLIHTQSMGSQLVTIPVSNFSSGIYLLQFESNNRITGSGKLLIH